jgi:hypothetical protein
MGQNVLTSLDVEWNEYDVNRQTYTVAPNTGCLVEISTGFTDALQVGSFDFFPPNNNMNYMMTKNSWSISQTSLSSAGLVQLN